MSVGGTRRHPPSPHHLSLSLQSKTSLHHTFLLHSHSTALLTYSRRLYRPIAAPSPASCSSSPPSVRQRTGPLHHGRPLPLGLRVSSISHDPADRSDTTSGMLPGRRQSRAGSFLGPPRLFAPGYYPTIQQTVVVDGALPGSEPKDEVKVRKRETIFGPDVGDDDQPGWTEAGDGNAVSVDVIKRWVDKAKGEEVSLDEGGGRSACCIACYGRPESVQGEWEQECLPVATTSPQATPSRAQLVANWTQLTTGLTLHHHAPGARQPQAPVAPAPPARARS